ncbi:MAG: hypothetical protein O3C40_23860 [Planctomycetota bacterium]|nr:hypothetical protein [Planctomycetota bacterium]
MASTTGVHARPARRNATEHGGLECALGDREVLDTRKEQAWKSTVMATVTRDCERAAEFDGLGKPSYE